MRRSFALPSLVALLCSLSACSGGTDGFGVVALMQGGIAIVDPGARTVSAPFLVDQLGTKGGGRFDVAIAPDGKTTLISNFGDSEIYFLDTSDPANPSLAGDVELEFFAEDIAIDPKGKFALVSDGGFSPKVAVIDLASRSLVETFHAPVLTTDEEGDPLTYDGYYNAIAIAADGQTVLAANYFDSKLHVLTLDAAGHLSAVSTIDLIPEGSDVPVRPVNVAISPDGKTAIAAISSSVDDAAMSFPVLKITAPGVVELVDRVSPIHDVYAAQSIAFNPSGTRAYLNCVQPDPDTEDEVAANNLVIELDVSGPGAVSDSGKAVEVEFVGQSQLFGVETLAIDSSGKSLYVSNMTMNGAKAQLQVVDLASLAVTKTLTLDPVDVDADEELEDTLPVGIAFFDPWSKARAH
jgi:DNA-binding beta-propeller fold protein YncE